MPLKMNLYLQDSFHTTGPHRRHTPTHLLLNGGPGRVPPWSAVSRDGGPGQETARTQGARPEWPVISSRCKRMLSIWAFISDTVFELLLRWVARARDLQASGHGPGSWAQVWYTARCFSTWRGQRRRPGFSIFSLLLFFFSPCLLLSAYHSPVRVQTPR